MNGSFFLLCENQKNEFGIELKEMSISLLSYLVSNYYLLELNHIAQNILYCVKAKFICLNADTSDTCAHPVS